MVLLFGPESFWGWYHFFSGAIIPDIFWEDLIYILLLLNISPILMWLGYELGLIAKQKIKVNFDAGFGPSDNKEKLIKYFFAISLFVGFMSILKTNSISNLGSWLNYNDWIHGRWDIFNTLSFFEFVNIYMLIPILGTLFFLSVKESNRIIVAILVLLSVTFIEVLLFQKKALVVSVLLFFFVIYVYYFGGHNPRKTVNKKVFFIAFIVALAIYLLYVVLVLLPVVLKTSESYKPKIKRTIPMTQHHKTKLFKVFDVSTKIKRESRNKSLVFYTLMAPLTRTSSPVLAYPIVFPEEHNFYTIDMGQDIIGIGGMPDDNYVIWNKLWPDTPGGAVAAPFQFVFYSQGGLIVAFIGSLLLGLIIAIGWSIINEVEKVSTFQSAFGGLIILFSTYLAIDSFRNSIIVSYGVFWPAIFLLFLYIVLKSLKVLRTPEEKN